MRIKPKRERENELNLSSLETWSHPITRREEELYINTIRYYLTAFCNFSRETKESIRKSTAFKEMRDYIFNSFQSETMLHALFGDNYKILRQFRPG